MPLEAANRFRCREREFLTAGDLRRRGWTGQLMREFAGLPDHLAVNPYHPGGPAMRLYRSERIEETEKTTVFLEARVAADRRQAAARKGLATKAQNAAASAAENIPAPVLPPAPRTELVAAAVRWFNESETWRTGAAKWLSTSDPEAVLFPIVVDFIRDRLRDYRSRARPIGLPVDEATAAVDYKIVTAIAARFPWLSEECGKRKTPTQRDPGSGAKRQSTPQAGAGHIST